MERIKNVVLLCVYISISVFVLSFIPSLFPVTESSQNAYAHMQEQFVKISESSSIDTEAMRTLVSEEEFHSGVSSDTVMERAKELFMDTNNFIYIYGEDALTQTAQQVQAIYEAEQDIAKDTQRNEVLQQVRILSGVVFGLSLAIVLLITYQLKKKRDKKVIG